MAERRLDQFNAQGLANTAWAFATVGQQDGQLFKALARMAERRLDQFNAQELANMAWAFATVGQQDVQLFKALAKMVELRLDQFNAQELANTAWAFATAGQQDEQLFKALARSPPFSVAWAISTVAWCLSLFFGIHFSIIFQDRIFMDSEPRFGSLLGSKITFFSIFSLIIFWASFLDRFFVDFGTRNLEHLHFPS